MLVVHSAFSRTGPLAGGPTGLIGALREVVGEGGTLVMPSMSDDDEVPFEVAATPCKGVGIVADTFWRMPGVLRSDSPHAFAAIGPAAAALTRPHPVEMPHGLDSPIGRAYELDAQVLLLGVGHDANTTIHLAEAMAGVRYRIPKYVMMRCGGVVLRQEYEEIDHCCARFALLDEWLDQAGRQVRGRVGRGEARLMRARDVVRTAVERLREQETVFLHQQGQCAECDDARRSLP